MQGIRKTLALILKQVFLVLFFLYSFCFSVDVNAQHNYYDTDLLTPQFHRERREALRKLLPENSCVVLFSNPVRNRSNDVNFQFSQDPDLYYLTGLNEPNAALILFTRPTTVAGIETDEVLFVQDRDPLSESWTGKRLGIEGAVTKLGIQTVFLNSEFKSYLPEFPKFAHVLVKQPVDIREKAKSDGTLNAMVEIVTTRLSDVEIEPETASLNKAMNALRQIKKPEELVLLQKAIDMSMEGIAEAIRAVQPGMTEYQAQAIVEFYFKNHGSEYPGYGSISGGGENSCVLHYVTNRKKLEATDLLLMDMGAEYHGYTADITRTVPVDGTFSEEQKLIYKLVLEAQMKGIDKARKGNNFYDPNTAAKEVIGAGLVKLGILKDASQVKKYFNHGTSHYLGLDVHDRGDYGTLQPGMVITVEPGIYIPEGSDCDKKWWNIGVRIEDDIQITDNEPIVMSGALVKTVVDIEKLMQQESIFNRIK